MYNICIIYLHKLDYNDKIPEKGFKPTTLSYPGWVLYQLSYSGLDLPCDFFIAICQYNIFLLKIVIKRCVKELPTC